MRVAVLGAGVVGVTTAYYLAEAGHEVTVLEQASGPAQGASGDNGGQLSWSFVDALASPALLRKMPAILAGKDSAMLLRPEFKASALAWAMAFIRQCRSSSERRNTRSVLKLALQSSQLMTELAQRLPLDFSFRRAGKLVLLDSERAANQAQDSIRLKRSAGVDTSLISFEEACRKEPCLEQFEGTYLGAVWSEDDEVGDTRAFTTGLTDWLQSERGVRFRFGESVQHLDIRNGHLFAIVGDQSEHRVDAAVVCLGAHSPQLLRSVGIRVHIMPVRGYSVTLPPGDRPNQVSITHQSGKFVFSRLNGAVRIAGFADFVGFNENRDRHRTHQLMRSARTFGPRIADWTAAEHHEWAGFRPLTPDSRPLVGPSRIRGLYLNTGHGMLGWTLAAASGKSVSDQITGY